MRYHESSKPPSWALKFFRWFCKPEIAEDIEGDLLERYHRLADKGRKQNARTQFVREVLALIKPGIVRPFFSSKNNYNPKNKYSSLISYAMFKNTIKTTIRSLQKQGLYTFINVLGLTVGITSSFLIFLWVDDEYKMDSFHENSENIYQLRRIIYQDDGQNFDTPAVPQPMENVLESSYPEVDKVTLVSWNIEALFKNDDNSFKEFGRYVRPEFLQIFSFPTIAGDTRSPLDEINSIVICESLAAKLFGTEWRNKAVGSNIPLGDDTFEVTAVLADPTEHSTLQFQWLIPAQRYISQNSWVEDWNNGGFGIIVLMKDGSDMDAFAEKILHEVNKNIQGADERVTHQKFSETYLYSSIENGVPVGGRIDYVRALFVIAICILIIACINFMNLATARSAVRVKEIGVRKVLGAGRKSLAAQFLSEAVVISLFATSVAILLVSLILPGFNQITGKAISLGIADGFLWAIVFGVGLLTGVVSGFYPALFLSGFKPLNVIHGRAVKIGEGSLLRKILVVFQFGISIVLIIGSVTIFRQIQFIMNKNLGLDRENVLYIPIEGELARNAEAYKTELLRIPNITSIGFSDQNPLSIGRSTGGANWSGKDPNFQIEISVLSADEDLSNTLKMNIIEGTGFSGEYYRDSSSYIINQELARLMNRENPIGEDLYIWGVNGTVVGVVEDFHMASLHEPIEPLIIRYSPSSRFAFVRIDNNITETIKSIEEVTARLNPGYPFQYTFLDEQFAEDYRNELMIADFAMYFTLVAIFISCLGLFGLSSFIAHQRVKEIGIRKVLGATTSNLFTLLSLNFAKLIIIAFIIAAPLGYYLSNNWLESFIYRISIGPSIFVIAGISALLIANLTVSFKAIQTALANPVDSLKEE